MDAVTRMGVIFLARRRLAARNAKPFGITLKQLFLLRWVEGKGSLSPSEAARLLFCDRPTATVIVRNCEKRGWLTRRRSEADGRSVLLELAEPGAAILARIDAAAVPGLAAGGSVGDPLDALEPAERRAFESSLKKVYRRAGELFRKGDE
ncbi:MAG: MarR family transcriptional regulator [Spirochaetaceae bacterium]|nr:MarR family transcriptional regulator [Spirochaetaceae bacterium]